jgi:hypothetical protein
LNDQDLQKKTFREQVWKTTLGVRAKLLLVATSEIGSVDGLQIEAPAEIFPLIASMATRKLSSVVRTLDNLQKVNVLLISPSETGYTILFRPENERHYAEEGKRRARA